VSRRRKRSGTAVARQRQGEGRGGEPRPSSVPATRVHAFELREGPIPDAAELARYGHAHPGAPEIILGEFRVQGEHRRLLERRASSLEREAMRAAIRSEWLGVASALFIALVGFACGTFLVAAGHGVEGTVVFVLDIGALVSTFLLGRARVSVPPRPDAPAPVSSPS
jgi:hypothetical protein